MGSRRAARWAGHMPKNTPMAADTSQGDDHGIHGDRRVHSAQSGQQGGTSETHRHTEDPAEQTQGQRFHQELEEDVPPGGPQGLPDADLPGALGDADQHDVHDPDAPDQEAYRADARQEEGEGLGGLLEGLH